MPKTYLCFLIIISCTIGSVRSQNLLSKPISIDVKYKKLADALKEISQKGGFYFSYNGKLFPKDSVVNIKADAKSIKEILNRLLGAGKYDFEERANYIIITAALQRLVLVNTDMTAENNNYSASGIVIDERTGERLVNASVYEKRLLAATLTDEHGYFRLKFRADNPGVITLTASKLKYKDTTISFLKAVEVKSRSSNSAYSNSRNKNRVERTGLGGLFISTRQKIQSMNIPDFFARRPFQISLSPGLSSHGMFSPQVVNKLSLNIAGGYTAGTNGLEIGGLFNINKEDAKYLQLAGIFNVVGGTVTGLQAAGVHNRALDTVKGVQVAGFINKAEGQMSGLQFSALNNSAHKLKGVQVGLVNTADTSQGASIGLVNIIGNGFYKATLSTSDLTNTNISFKTGTHNFYTALLVGINIAPNNKLYTIGFGMGHDFMLNDKVYVSAEAAFHFMDADHSWGDHLVQGKLLLNVQLSNNISLVAGPTFNRYSSNNNYHFPGYKNIRHLPDFNDVIGYPPDNLIKRWIGWEAGIAFNSVFKSAPKVVDNSSAWYLGAASTLGIGWDDPYREPIYGVELFTHRDLGENITGTLTTGYTYFSINNYLSTGFGNNFEKPVKMIPVKAGIRLKTGKSFFIAGEIGGAFGLFNEAYFSGNNYYYNAPLEYKPYQSLMYAVSAGFSFKSGLETGIKFEDYGLQKDYKQFALRLGYRLKLSK